MKKLTLLGSTGSIGRQTLQVLPAAGYTVHGLAAYENIGLLLEQIKACNPAYVAVVNSGAAERLKSALAGQPGAPTVLSGEEGLASLAGQGEADMLLNAASGAAGLASTLAAANAGTPIALANKESLVTGGQLVIDTVKKHGVPLLPVDSEHSAIFQCLQNNVTNSSSLARILLTASGGPFFGFKAAQLANVTKEQALRHPNWNMGVKITIDSATLMNKGLEFIEAVWLFDVLPSQISILVHRQSIIHSMVEFCDGAVIAQLGTPDMRLPIQYALTYPKRVPGPGTKLDFTKLAALTFDEPDEETFRCLAACKKAMEKGGLYPCAANGASEAAVALFLNDEITFQDIGRLVEGAVDTLNCKTGAYMLDDVRSCDTMARAYVKEHC